MPFSPLNGSREKIFANLCSAVSTPGFAKLFAIVMEASGALLARVAAGFSIDPARLISRPASAAVTAAATAAFFARASLVHRQGATLPVFAVQSGDGGRCRFLSVHCDKGE